MVNGAEKLIGFLGGLGSNSGSCIVMKNRVGPIQLICPPFYTRPPIVSLLLAQEQSVVADIGNWGWAKV